MSRQKKYTAPEGSDQAAKLIDEEWEEQVLRRLPAETEEQAFRLRAFVREREVKRVGDLLRALLAYVLCVSSFRHLGSWAVLLGIANISDAAWRKRLGAWQMLGCSGCWEHCWQGLRPQLRDESPLGWDASSW